MAQAQVKTLLQQLRTRLDAYPLAQRVEDATKAPKEAIAAASFSLLALGAIVSVGAPTLCNIVGFAYPAYCSAKAIESPTTADNTQWLTYWVLFSLFAILESFHGVLLSFIPFFYALKVGFLVWAMLPNTQGATLIYNSAIKPRMSPSKATAPGATVKPKAQ